jgi:Ca2+-binding RTX toxin-like protein
VTCARTAACKRSREESAAGADDVVLVGALGPAIAVDLIRGDADNDSLTGPPGDLARDTLDGGAGTDTCQGPGLLYPDSLTACNP